MGGGTGGNSLLPSYRPGGQNVGQILKSVLFGFKFYMGVGFAPLRLVAHSGSALAPAQRLHPPAYAVFTHERYNFTLSTTLMANCSKNLKTTNLKCTSAFGTWSNRVNNSRVLVFIFRIWKYGCLGYFDPQITDHGPASFCH